MPFQTYTWSDIQTYLTAVLPHLAADLQAFVPNSDSHVHVGRYAYGEPIMTQGRGPWPVGIVLTRAAEQYIEQTPYTLPLAVLQPGQSLGLPYYLHHEHEARYDICAGARSLCLLPPLPPSEHTANEGAFLASLLKERPTNWQCEVLWFEHSWLASPGFQHYLYRHAGEQHTRLPAAVSVVLADCLQRHANKIEPYVTATLQHVLQLAYGVYPGFRPQGQDESLAPVVAIQRALMSQYQLSYLPTLMAPCSLSQHPMIYYSCERPSLLYPGKIPPLNKKQLHELAQLVSELQHHLAVNQLVLPDISCFYAPARRSGKLQSSFVLSATDKAFLAEQKMFPHLNFCYRAPFLQGVVRIKRDDF